MEYQSYMEGDITFEWLQSRFSPPDFEVAELFHYTNQTGFLGILRDQKIRATHVGHLNDRSEIEHAVELITEHVKDLRHHAKPVLPKLLDWILTNLHGMTAQKTGIFVVSFSGNEDSLPQWDRYSPDFGYAMGFDRSRLNLINRVSDLNIREANLIKILYSDKDKRSAIANTISQLLDGANSLGLVGFTTDGLFMGWNRDFLMSLRLLLTGLKHEAYISEEEYRLVVTHDPRIPTLAREGRHGIATYVTLEAANSQPLPLTSVVTGPSHYPESAIFAVQQLLVGTLGFDAVRNSKIPKRT